MENFDFGTYKIYKKATPLSNFVIDTVNFITICCILFLRKTIYSYDFYLYSILSYAAHDL